MVKFLLYKILNIQFERTNVNVSRVLTKIVRDSTTQLEVQNSPTHLILL
jgi:hypothetical protein